MNNQSKRFLERRIKQSYKLDAVMLFASKTTLSKRHPPETNPVTGIKLTTKDRLVWLHKSDIQNIILLLDVIGQNKEPISKGMYFHPIELAKVIGVFAKDHLTDEHLDSGTVRVARLMAGVSAKLLSTRAQILTNYPAAGYRIASNEEACLEAKKSVLRSFGNIKQALVKAFSAVNLKTLPPVEKERFEEVRLFCNKMTSLYKQEIETVGDERPTVRAKYKKPKDDMQPPVH